MAQRVQSFPPVIGARARVLILGTMPGQASLAKNEYYGHPRNMLWRIVEPWCGGPATPYAERCARLAAAGISLWDVLHECEREGSADSAIARAQPNDVLGLLLEHGSLRQVLFNGQTARKLFDRLILRSASRPIPERIELHTLPSTSPANARSGKLEVWRTTLTRTLDRPAG